MTISTTIIKNSYSGNGSQTVFPYNFKVLAQGDIEVIIRAADGSETVKTIQTDYTVSGVGSDNGGNVTCVSFVPTATETVVLRRGTAQTQSLDLVENDPFTADSVEGAFDRAIAIAQELQEGLDRSIKISRTNAMASTEFTVDAASRANKVLAFDAAGELSIAQALGDYQGNWASGRSYNQRDLVKDASNDNIYICIVAHTSGGSTPISTNADVANWVLIVDAEASYNSIAAAEAARDVAIANAALTTVDAATATSQAGISTTQAGIATTQAGIATSGANTATTKAAEANVDAGIATTKASEAAASAVSAAASAGGGIVRVTANDTNPNVLTEKFLAGTDITFTVTNAGADEKISIGAPYSIVYAIALGG